MDETTDRPWLVEYEGMDLRLTRSEYVALKTAALDDPVGAVRMARDFLAAANVDLIAVAAVDLVHPPACWPSARRSGGIVEEHAELLWRSYQPGGGLKRTGKCRVCAENEDADYDGAPLVEWPCPTLRTLAAVYASHPDYREEWRP